MYVLEDTGGGGGGTSDYADLQNKPLINGIELSGEISSSLLYLPMVYEVNDLLNIDNDTMESLHVGDCVILTNVYSPTVSESFAYIVRYKSSASCVLSSVNGAVIIDTIYTKTGDTWSYTSTADIDISNKATIVEGAVEGNFAGLNEDGDLTDSGVGINNIPRIIVGDEYNTEPSLIIYNLNEETLQSLKIGDIILLGTMEYLNGETSKYCIVTGIDLIDPDMDEYNFMAKDIYLSYIGTTTGAAWRLFNYIDGDYYTENWDIEPLIYDSYIFNLLEVASVTNGSVTIPSNVFTIVNSGLSPISNNVTINCNTGSPHAGSYTGKHFIFATGNPAPTITWPNTLTWAGGNTPNIQADKKYEVRVLPGGLATITEY